MTTKNALRLRWRLLAGVVVMVIGMGVLNIVHRVVTGGDVMPAAFNLGIFVGAVLYLASVVGDR